MKIAISGISGFLGSHLAAFFSKENEVSGISTSIREIPEIPVYSFEQLHQIDNPDIVIHCHAAVASGNTAPDQKTLFDANVLATEKITAYFPKAAHLYISSVSVYGAFPETIDECSAASPLTDYAISKYWGEIAVLKSEKSAVIRLSSLFGNGMKENTLIPNYTNQAVQNEQIEVWGNGERKQNYIHISDVAKLIEAIILKQAWNRNVFLGVDEQEHSNLETAKIIASLTRAEIVFKHTDHALSVHYNNIFTQNSVNWRPETTLSEGLKQYLAWKKRQS